MDCNWNVMWVGSNVVVFVRSIKDVIYFCFPLQFNTIQFAIEKKQHSWSVPIVHQQHTIHITLLTYSLKWRHSQTKWTEMTQRMAEKNWWRILTDTIVVLGDRPLCRFCSTSISSQCPVSRSSPTNSQLHNIYSLGTRICSDMFADNCIALRSCTNREKSVQMRGMPVIATRWPAWILPLWMRKQNLVCREVSKFRFLLVMKGKGEQIR